MSATIHYLRPFEREDLSASESRPTPEQHAVEEMAVDDETPARELRTRRHQMPCGRNSRFKKRMDGTVVPRDKR